MSRTKQDEIKDFIARNANFFGLENNEEEVVVDLKYIVKECPPTRVMREFMRHQAKKVNKEDDEFSIDSSEEDR